MAGGFRTSKKLAKVMIGYWTQGAKEGMHRKSLVVNVFLCLVFLMTGCGNAGVAPPTATIPTPTFGPTGLTYVVQRGRVTRGLEFNGRISPVEERPLYFETSGYVKQVFVQQGDQVRSGDLLAELEVDDLLKQIDQAEVSLNSAQLLRSEAEKALTQQSARAELELAIAEATLTQAQDANAYTITQAELSLELAREQLTRAKGLKATYSAAVVTARTGLESSEDAVKRAEIEYREALDRFWEPQEVQDSYARALQQTQWNLEVAQAEYDRAVADQENHQHDLRIQEIVIKQAEAEVEQLKKGIDPLLAIAVEQARQELEWLQEGVDPVLVNDVNQAQLALERLQGHLADAQIVAPVDGEVISLSLYPGRLVEAFRVGIILADPSAIEVRSDVSEEQLRGLTEGQKATLVLSTDPDRVWAGTVRCLPYPFGTCGSTDSSAGSSRSVRISLGGGTDDFRIGALVQVTIILEEKVDVLWLPPDAVRSFQGRTIVTVQDSERQQRVDVELGIVSNDRVEILKGLEEGQLVVAP
jgi:multidrug efflux pump subunit AcrA (membrane-fusion protein)